MRLALLLTTLALLILQARPAAACSCDSFQNALDYAQLADVVFEGVLESIVQRGFRSENVFSVDRVWKGQVATSISIDTAGTECDDIGIHDTCGIEFELGERYLVFAQGGVWSKCRPTADLCSGTRSSARAEEAFSQLGAGQPPADPGSLPPREPCLEEHLCPDVPDADASAADAPMTLPIPSDAGAGLDSSSTSSGGPRLVPVEQESTGGCGCRAPLGNTSSTRALFSASLLLMLAWWRRKKA